MKVTIQFIGASKDFTHSGDPFTKVEYRVFLHRDQVEGEPAPEPIEVFHGNEGFPSEVSAKDIQDLLETKRDALERDYLHQEHLAKVVAASQAHDAIIEELNKANA